MAPSPAAVADPPGATLSPSTESERSRWLLEASDLRAAVPGWVAGRVLTAVGWLLAWLLVEHRLDGVRPEPMLQGLFAWDGVFYRSIAEEGYAATSVETARFHPLFALLGHNGLGLLVLANVAALLAAALVHRLVVEVRGDRDLARRAATIVGIAPPAFCLSWAYGEGLFLVLSGLVLLTLHRRWWWWAGVAGALATLTRPTGVLLAVAAVAAVLAAGRGEGRYLARAAAVAAPGVAMLGWLAWTEWALGSAEAPLRVQSGLRDGTHFPPFRLIEGVGEVITEPLGDGLHIPFAACIVVLAWVAWRRLPAAWGWYGIASAAVILSAGNLNSIERYALGTMPFVVAGAILVAGRWWRPVVVVSGAGLVGMSALAWYGSYVP